LHFARSSPALEVSLTVKECAGVGITNHPVSAVVPLPPGSCHSTTQLCVALQGGGTVPSQCSVLERWRADNSLRHVRVQFPVSVPASGTVRYVLRDGTPLPPTQPVIAQETPTNFTLVTGPLRCLVPKNSGRLLSGVWLDRNSNVVFESSEQLAADHPRNGGAFVPRAGAGAVQYDGDRTNLTVTLEESGPFRTVIRLASPARFSDTGHHDHGFAVRLYAYAGQSWLKMDYQLQNSDRTVARSWPLYFESMDVDFRLNLSGPVTQRFGLGNGTVLAASGGHGAFLAQEMHNRFRIYDAQTLVVLHDPGVLPAGSGPDGFIDAGDAQWGVMAVIRNFWQTWPNGLLADSQNRISLQLFPSWSAQWQDGQISPSGLYWLEDMQHVLKESLLFFHGSNLCDIDRVRLARTFQFPPVVVVPADWYRQTRATLDLGGVIPPTNTIPEFPDARQPSYDSEWFNASNYVYGAGWVNFRDPEPGYRNSSCTTGGWPYSGAAAVASGNPADLFAAGDFALGEINVRPEWMDGYEHDMDWPLLQLTENPYCGGTWRIFEGHGIPTIAAPRLPGTGDQPLYGSRDDQHGWFYHVSDAYWLTGNPWLLDWYRFIGEFRRTRLDRLDPWPDTSSRATAHALSHALHACRATGDSTILDRFASHVRGCLRPEQDPFYGDQRDEVEPSGGGFQTGYLMRCLVNYLEELRAAGRWQDYAEGFQLLSGLMEWNLNHGNFAYYFNARTGTGSSSDGSGLTLVDPQAWYYWHTGRRAYWEHVQTYVNTGIHGGGRPYGQFSQWSGQFEGRYYLLVKNTIRDDTNPPARITNIQAVPGGGKVLLKWTAPADAARHHVVWGLKPITAQSTLNPSTLNWWAANAIGPDFAPQPGRMQRVVIDPGTNATVHGAVFSFDGADNMSEMSVVASTAGVVPDTQPPTIQSAPVTAWVCPLCPTNGVPVFYSQTVVDNTDPGVAVQYSPPSGSLFKPGTSVVQCVATDFAGNAATSSFPVTVLGTPARTSILVDGTNVNLGLPMGCVHYQAQRSTNITGGSSWNAVTNHVLTNGGLRFQCVPVQKPREYFRLMRGL
jgi:hypothetical protein